MVDKPGNLSDHIYVAVIIWVVIIVFNLLLTLANRNNVFTRCCCASNRFLGITNRAAFVSRASVPRLYWAWDLLDARHLVTGVVHPAVLLMYRFLVVAFFVFTMIWQAVGPDKLASAYGKPGRWITFFTNWTFVLFGLYGLLGMFITWKELYRRGQRWHTEAASQPFKVWDKAFLLVLVCACTCGITLTIFYWAIIFDGGAIALDNPFRHGANIGFMLGDILLSRTPVVTYHFQAAVLYGTGYLVFMWVLYAIGDYWRYRSLDGAKPGAIGTYIALCFLLIFSFIIMYLVAGLREFLKTGKCCCMCRPQCGACCQEDEAELKQQPPAEFDAVVIHNNPMHTGPLPGMVGEGSHQQPQQQQMAQFMAR